MRVKAEMIGDESSIDSDIQDLIRKSERLPQAMDKGANTIVNKAKSIASSKGLNKTGAGVAGIMFERDANDRLIGWDKRPNFHLYFHEVGTYKDRPRPHIRPAAEQSEEQIIKQIEQDTIGN